MSTLEVVTKAASTSARLDALFHPRSIAFIGASERPNAPASRGLRHCIRLGFRGGLYPVNPKHQALFGARCYPSLESAPAPVDLAMIALGADATIDAVAACQKAGVKVVVACSSGWDEIGPAGAERSARLRRLLAGSSMRLLGPNCLGSGNPALGMCLAYNSSFESVSFPRRGPIGLVTQSGAMLGGIVLNSEDVGADIGLFAHVGNAMDIGMEEIMEHMILDPAITVLALMVEGVRQPDRFVAAARKAREAGKPVVVFKAGASEIGRRAVLSHTGALAGADEVFSAVCREEGIIRVDEPEDLMQAAQLMASWRKKAPTRGRLLVYTLSGGVASIMADECATVGVTLPELSESTLSRLSGMLPSYTRAANPLDVGGGVFSDPDLPRKSLAIAVEDANMDAVLWIGVGAPRDERSKTMLGEALDIMRDCRIPGAVVPVSGYPEEPGFNGAREMGIPVLRSLRSAAKLVAQAVRAHGPLAARGAVPGVMPELPAGHVIDEVRAKQALVRLGIPVPESRVAARREDVAGLARQVGFPVVVKGLVDGVTHKSEAGLVALGLATAEAAEEAAGRMMQTAGGATVRGFLVERMVGDGVEVVLGIKRDHEFGQVIMFGLGGIAVELFRDVAFATCPLSAEGARELIGLTRAARLLGGYRGRAAADEDALVEAMVRLSQFAAHHGADLEEMDVNPLVVLPKGQGVMALDAVIVRRKT